jgi:hypothetical protein
MVQHILQVQHIASALAVMPSGMRVTTVGHIIMLTRWATALYAACR